MTDLDLTEAKAARDVSEPGCLSYAKVLREVAPLIDAQVRERIAAEHGDPYEGGHEDVDGADDDMDALEERL